MASEGKTQAQMIAESYARTTAASRRSPSRTSAVATSDFELANF